VYRTKPKTVKKEMIGKIRSFEAVPKHSQRWRSRRQTELSGAFWIENHARQCYCRSFQIIYSEILQNQKCCSCSKRLLAGHITKLPVKISPNFQGAVRTSMNWLDFQVKRSKIKVTARSRMHFRGHFLTYLRNALGLDLARVSSFVNSVCRPTLRTTSLSTAN